MASADGVSTKNWPGGAQIMGFFAAAWGLFSKTARVRFAAAVAVSCLLFLPWLGVIWTSREAVRAAAGWIGTRAPAGRILAGVLDSLVAAFADAPQGPGTAFRGR